jgi:hypothetical protein
MFPVGLWNFPSPRLPLAASPEIAAEIRAALPVYGETPQAPAAAPAPSEAEQEMAAKIPRLRAGTRQSRPPNGEEVLTAQGKTELAMDQYLGRPDGFDRGLLNRYTIPQLWQMIPVLKYLPCPIPAVTNEVRAMALKADDQYFGALHEETEFSGLSEAERNPSAVPAHSIKLDPSDGP